MVLYPNPYMIKIYISYQGTLGTTYKYLIVCQHQLPGYHGYNLIYAHITKFNISYQVKCSL